MAATRLSFKPLAGAGAALALLATLPAQAAEPQRPLTLELSASHGSLTAGLPDDDVLSLRGTLLRADGEVWRAEALQQRKFGATGGGIGIGGVWPLSTDWILSASGGLGHGGPNWANQRADVELTTKWTVRRVVETRVAAYTARYDGDRSDVGLRLAAVGYLLGFWEQDAGQVQNLVIDGGITLNVSQPGRVHSHMPYLSATLGREGYQYLSLRAARGTEAYQATGAGFAPLPVGFRSWSLGLSGRRWLGPDWGLLGQAERYGNPSYRRTTLGLGLFAQW